MLEFLSGELNNSAFYFSSFAHVSISKGTNINGTFGREESETWKPWKYSHRLDVIKQVETKKELKRKNF